MFNRVLTKLEIFWLRVRHPRPATYNFILGKMSSLNVTILRVKFCWLSENNGYCLDFLKVLTTHLDD